MAEDALVGRKSEEGSVEVLVLRHPPVNALSTALLAELDLAVGELAADAKVRAVVLTGDGQYFSAGADVKEMATLGLSSAPEVARKGLAVYARLAALR
ncbi:MAG: enoyl-CoA hydratase-related protein, partial [Thermoplasmata archaeon]